DATFTPPITTAAAVSSHEVSIPRTAPAPGVEISTIGGRNISSLDPGRVNLVHERVDPLAILGPVNVARPHDEPVLVDLGVVVLADPDGHETERLVELLRPDVGHPNLEGERLGTPVDGGRDHCVEKSGRDPASVPLRG